MKTLGREGALPSRWSLCQRCMKSLPRGWSTICVLRQSAADRNLPIHVIARHVEAAVERSPDGFARGSGRVRSREPPEREEPGGRRMSPGLQNHQASIPLGM